MSISPGTRFGSYEIVEPIGSGGMGEVYRARDPALGRDVALKVLPASFSSDAMRVARFEQEAKTLASLNHANIAHIYGLERADGSTGIAMELVDGQTLVDRIAEGPIPVAEALRIATQIADALEAAHERAIVHRDLKPGNVKIKPDGTVKVLDFGIAKALDPRFLTGPGPAALTTPAMTEAGFILGTAAYMSPEQARGKFVDQRTDIWAFGCVLYEMLTGKPAFLGEDVTSTLARVLEVGANLSALPTGVPPAVRRTLELCLEKDARKRIADMRDVKLALAGTFATGAPARPLQRLALPVAAGAVAAALLAGAAAWLLKPAPTPEPKIVTRFNYALPAGVSFRIPVTSVLDVAPGGELFAFNGSDGFYVRKMGEIEARAVPGTTGALADVVISPDGRDIAYFRIAPPQLLKVAIGGGAPVVLADPAQLPFGLSWEPDGTLYYGQPDGIWRVSHNGGTPEHVVKTESRQQAYGPQLLPGGEWLLFTLSKTAGANRWNDADIVVQSLKSGERRVLRSGGFDARYLPSGHITYAFQNVLFASPFDAKTLKLDDERVALVQGMQTASPSLLGGSAFYAVSNNGTLVFVPGAAGSTLGRPQRSLVWVDRQGNKKPLPVRPDDYTMARLSPDGTRIALVVGSTLPASDPPPDIYIFDLKTENLTQLTFNPQADDAPVWSRDGSRIFYRAYDKDGIGAVAAVSADGGTPEILARSESGNNPLPWSVSPDGETLLLVNAATLQDVNLATVGIGKDNTVKPLLDLTEQLSEPSLSPNGQWLLYYQFPETGSTDYEIDIRPFPDVRQQRRPVGPGAHPVFSADGSEIFLFDGAGLSVAPVQYSPLRVGGARKLFRGQFWYGVAGPNGGLGRAWDVDSKNDRFLMITLPAADSAGAPAQAEIEVVVNWSEELRQRVPKH
jgi:eukaryotic-like serine/threonine-protein kinase